METQALKFMANQPGGRPLRSSLDLENPQQFEAARGKFLPAAYVIRKQGLAALRKFQDLIVDRGGKHKAKALSTLLLGQQKIPLIDGNYGNPGQLKRSVQRLLANASERGERNLYLIGTGEEIFNALWDQAGQTRARADLARWPGNGTVTSSLILEMMGPCEEPEELSQKYVGESVEAQLVRQLILRAARIDDTVLILGDTGTGKELVARAIHDYSKRGAEKFMAVNCGAIPNELLESELFGHEKGAFTTAIRDKKGLWQDADKGSLFLDEIGDLSLQSQVKILRALQEGKIRPVGGNKDIRVDARVIAATNRDLYSMIQTGQFREDLYYRLREFMIYTPALRNHPEDIPLLAGLLWRKITQDEKKTLPQEILRGLQSYRWPGNARELKMVLNNLRALFRIDHLQVGHLRAIFLLQGQTVTSQTAPVPSQEMGLREVECLGHLHRVEEVIHATEVGIRPVLKIQRFDKQAVPPIQESIRSRLNELEMLCFRPLLFHREAIFSEVNEFKGKLAYFQGLLGKNPREAQRYWEKEVLRGIHHALANIAWEVKLLLGGTS